MPVGFIGLGSMGGALAARLALKQDLVAYDRDAAAVASAAEVASSCDTVHLCLPTSDHVRALLFGDDGMARHLSSGTLVIDHTTGDPTQTRAIAAELREAHVEFVDAPVSGGVKGAEAGTIAIMVGAPAEVQERVTAAHSPISPNVFFAGEVGTGHAIKLVNNLLSCAQRLLTLEAMALATVALDRQVNSLQGHFLAAGSHDAPVRYEVELVRDGRSFSSRSVRAFQGDREVLHLAASFHVPEEGLEHQSAMPAAPPPEHLPPLHEVMARASTLPHEVWRHEWSGLDVRYVPDNLTDALGCTPAVQQMWVKTRDRLPDDPALHRQVLAYLSDHTLLASALVPHGFMLGDPELPRATLNHSFWFHDDARADEWLLVDQRSPWAGGARGVSFASIHSADGRRIASMAQEGLIRPSGALRDRLGVR